MASLTMLTVPKVERRVGLDALGGRCVFASEIDPFASGAYARNFGDAHLHGDVTEVPTEAVPEHDILTAGAPRRIEAGGRRPS